MLALLEKDIYIIWKKTRAFLLLLLLYLVMSAGNQTFFVSFSVIFAAMLPVTVMGYDEKSKWDRLVNTMPISRKQIVLSRYLFGLAAIIAVTLLYLVLSLVLTPVVFRESWTVDRLYLALMVDAGALVMQALYFPLLFRFGVEKGRLSTLISLAAVCAVIGGSGALGIATKEQGAVLTELFSRPWLMLVLLWVVAVVGQVISFPISVRQYSKREF